ncbi:MFS transporter [Flavisphingomonas formosensis]|uniref:MFS transporter n=1 Tax=Flavisphingomonas formosensis TaxID=861534 RepID=UPI0012FCBA96|nr:MFS transporter [Sphingomonas formosensis]
MIEHGRSRRLWLYPLANVGAYLAFLPLLTVVLPLRAEALAGNAKVTLLSEALLAGVAVATVANVAAGMASDWSRARFGTRLPWLWIGLFATWASFALIAAASGTIQLTIGVMLFQFAFNTLFGPLAALFADSVPDRFKGRISALANLALPLASLASALIGLPLMGSDAMRMLVLGAAVGALVLPLLLFWPRAVADAEPEDVATPTAFRWSAFRSLWLAKFLVQLCGNVVTSYFLFYLKDGIRPDGLFRGQDVQVGFAWIVATATLLSALSSIAIGRASDRAGRRKPFLLVAVMSMAAGILAMLLRGDWTAALIGYTLFMAGLGSFLTIDIALVAQILPSPLHRGRDLGVMNAANTLPAILGPAVAFTVLSRSPNDYGALFLLLLAALAGCALTLIASRALR